MILDDKSKLISLKYETNKCDGGTKDGYHISLTEAKAINIDDYIKFGNESIVIEYQDINKLEYQLDFANVNITLYKDISGNWNNTVNDINVSFQGETIKFFANDSSLEENETWEFKYQLQSDLTIFGGSWKYRVEDPVIKRHSGFMGYSYREGHQFDFTDICSRDFYNETTNVTIDANCNFNLFEEGGLYYLDVTFFSDSNIDPTITISEEDVVSNSLLNNVTDETGDANFTHLNISIEAPYNDLISYWNFDGDVEDTTGTTAYDWSGTGNDGTYVGDANASSFGCLSDYGECASFDRTNDRIGTDIVYNVRNWDGVTVTAWVNWTEAIDDEHSIAGNFKSADPFFALQVEPDCNDCLEAFIGATNGVIEKEFTGAIVTQGEWHHVAMTYDKTTLFVYVDGVRDSQNASGQGGGWDVSSIVTPIGIGSKAGNGAGELFNGQMDEVMVFNVSLTEAEILAIYENSSSRFVPQGTQEFDDQTLLNLSGTDVNVTTTFDNNSGSIINLSIGFFSGGSWDITDAQTINSGVNASFATGVTYSNLTLNYTLIAGNSTDTFYSPIMFGDIIVVNHTVAAGGDATTVRVVETVTVTDITGRFGESFRQNSLAITITNLVNRFTELFKYVFQSITQSDAVIGFKGNFARLVQAITITDNLNSFVTRFTFLPQAITITDNLGTLINRVGNIFQTITITNNVDRLIQAFTFNFQQVTLTDNFDRFLEAFRFTFQQVTITDIVGTLTNRVANIFQTVTITDNVNRLIQAFRFTFQQVTITDNLNSFVTRFTFLPQGVTITDIIGALTNRVTNIFQTVTITDNVNRLFQALRFNFQQVTITDNVNRLFQALRFNFQQVTITDNVNSFINRFTFLPQTISITDIVNRLFEGFRFNSETVTTSDSTTRTLFGFIRVTQAITITDNLGTLINRVGNIFQTITITDNVNRLIQAFRFNFQQVTLTDNLNNFVTRFTFLPQTITITDNIGTLINRVANIFQTITITDNVNRLIQAFRFNFQQVTFTDIVITDLITTFAKFTSRVIQAITITDNLGTLINRVGNIFQTITITDNVGRFFEAFRFNFQQVTLTDNINRLFEGLRFNFQQVTITDNLGTLINRVGNIFQTVTITDIVNRLFEGFRFNSETVTTSDSTTRTLFGFIRVTQAITITDNLGTLINRVANIFQTILIAFGINTSTPSGDTTAPTITLVTPEQGSADTDGVVRFIYIPTDLSTINNCSLIYQSGVYTTSTNITDNVTNIIEVTGIGDLHPLLNDDLQWSINCTDEFNNEGNSTVRNLDTDPNEVIGGGGGGGGGVLIPQDTTKNPKSVDFLYPEIWFRNSEVELTIKVFNQQDELYEPDSIEFNFLIEGVTLKSLNKDESNNIIGIFEINDLADLNEHSINITIKDERTLEKEINIKITKNLIQGEVEFRKRTIFRLIALLVVFILLVVLLLIIIDRTRKRNKEKH